MRLACGLLTALFLVSSLARADEPPLAPPAAPAVARVHVECEGDAQPTLESHAPGSPLWTSCCRAPCDADLPVDRDYRFTADGMRPSWSLRLAPPPGAAGAGVVLHVQPVSQRVHTASLVLVAAGVALFTAGDAMSDVFLALEIAKLADKEPVPAFASELIVPGLIIAAVGAAAFATGGALFLSTRNPTTVVQSPAPPVLEHDDAAERSLPRAVTAPIVVGTF